jgi:pimeloyl-ACP methyl ester carboxylesterase
MSANDTETNTPPFGQRFLRGLMSILGMLLFPLGRFGRVGGEESSTEDRLQNGLIVVLPGIECRSFLNRSLVRGLIEGGVQSAVEIWDWTTGLLILFPLHLRLAWYHRRIANRFAKRISDYQKQYPGRPVQLVGHSGGGGMALFILEALPESRTVTSAILLGPAVSPYYDTRPAQQRTQHGIRNYYSLLDIGFLGISTIVLGTMDGWHWPSAGMIGFQENRDDQAVSTENSSSAAPLNQHAFRPAMFRQYNFGGHFGWTNRVFAAETLAPIFQRNERA